MSQNIAASIHNRVSTLCQSYVRKYHPEDWAKLRAKAEHEYKFEKRRRNSEDDLEIALSIQIAKVPSEKPIVMSTPDDENYWSDPDFPTSSDEKEE
jgi:hypothetical protein